MRFCFSLVKAALNFGLQNKGSKLVSFFLPLYFCVIFFAGSCVRSGDDSVNEPAPVLPQAAVSGARPMAILQTGEQPLWFQLTDNGPVHLVTINEALYSAALIPWTLALHICLLQETQQGLVTAVNRYGFLKLTPQQPPVIDPQLALYRFPGGNFWQQYTVGGFVLFEDKPAALLYPDNRFYDSNAPVPHLRTWSINMDSNAPFPINIPALEFFPAEEGWEADALRLGYDGFWYYRVRRSAPAPEIQTLRTADLSQAGERVSLEAFFNSAARETDFFDPSLPPLPEGFVYTGIGRIGDNLFASWEEQVEFYIGAAGFVVLKPAVSAF